MLLLSNVSSKEEDEIDKKPLVDSKVVDSISSSGFGSILLDISVWVE